MSASDTLSTLIIGGVFSLVGVAVGVLLRGEIESQRRNETKAEKLILLTSRATSVMIGLLNYIGMNHAKLAPILGENIDGRTFSKEEFQNAIDSALSVFPIPEPQPVPQPENDPYGYTVIEISKLLGDFVRRANEAARELKAGNREPKQVSEFLIWTNTAANIDFIIGTARTQFEIYTESLESIYGRRFDRKERQKIIDKFQADMRRNYDVAVEMGRSKEGWERDNQDFLRRIDW